MNKTRYMYMCATDFNWHLGEDINQEGKVPMYSSLKELKQSKKCYKECGIVKVKIEVCKIITKGKKYV